MFDHLNFSSMTKEKWTVKGNKNTRFQHGLHNNAGGSASCDSFSFICSVVLRRKYSALNPHFTLVCIKKTKK